MYLRVADGSNGVGDRRLSIVWNVINHIVSVSVSVGMRHRLPATLDNDFHFGNGGSIHVTQVSFHFSDMLAGTWHRIGLFIVCALAVNSGAHLIYIIDNGRHGCVFIGHLGKVGFHYGP